MNNNTMTTSEIQNNIALNYQNQTKRDTWLSLLRNWKVTQENKVGWAKAFDKWDAFIQTGKPQWKVFTKGNSKLPFLSFSALPGVTCPGAGVCLDWCYSFKAWRYPDAFFRQLQNSILVQDSFDTIVNELSTHKGDLRLYVDGDFDSMETLDKWMTALKALPDVRAYGYSKSLELFIDYTKQFPDNYKLNLSSGHRYQQHIVDKVKALSVCRGEFVAVTLSTNYTSTDKRDDSEQRRQYKRDVRAAAEAQYPDSQVFVCPDVCGECTKKGHACGMDAFNDVVIAIGIH